MKGGYLYRGRNIGDGVGITIGGRTEISNGKGMEQG